MTQLTDRHNMFGKLNELNTIASVLSVPEFQFQMNHWDNELTDYMKSAENKCRSFCHNWVEYSPDLNAWWRRRWLLKCIHRYLQGKVPDPATSLEIARR